MVELGMLADVRLQLADRIAAGLALGLYLLVY
jgi:hypothetical protein